MCARRQWSISQDTDPTGGRWREDGAMFSRRTAAQLTGWGRRTADPAALAGVVGRLAFSGPARASPPGH